MLLVAIFALGLGTIVPAGKKLTSLAAAGTSGQEVDEQIGRLRLLSWVDVALLAAAFFVMTTKPF